MNDVEQLKDRRYFEKAVAGVRVNAFCHDNDWQDKDDLYWLAGLIEEIGELAESLKGNHEHLPVEELMQIGGIAVNWIERELRTPDGYHLHYGNPVQHEHADKRYAALEARLTALVEAASSLRAAAFMVIRAVEADNKLGNRPDYVTNIDMNMDYLKKAHRWVDEALAAANESHVAQEEA